jgi:2-iminobutanoate/2-iminopropanoate deaminase
MRRAVGRRDAAVRDAAAVPVDVRTCVEAQARQVFANLDAVARAAGGSLASAVRVGVYLTSLDLFDEMDAIYRTLFVDPLPARTTIQSALVGFDIEADAVVYLGS